MKPENDGSKFNRLVEIMATLRSSDGCPWDREQTHTSLRQYLLEEAYEVLEALDNQDNKHLREELGDLLLQIIFHAQIASEAGAFDIDDVVDGICDKLIRRHPNVFGDVKINSAAEQAVNWEKIKKAEGKKSAIDGVPAALSALLRSWRIQQKAATVGFDWPEAAPIWEKITEETAELRQAVAKGEKKEMEDELGDLLFSVVNLSRFIEVNPEDALRGTIEKFARRFRGVEAHFERQGLNMRDKSLAELDEVWEQIKSKESKESNP